MSQDQGLIKIQDQGMIDSNLLEEQRNQCGVIEHNHITFLGRQILLNVLAVSVTDVIRT